MHIKAWTTAVSLCLAGVAMASDLHIFAGSEDWARDKRDNTSQTWVGLQYTADYELWWGLHPYLRVMSGVHEENPLLVAAGLSISFVPFPAIEDLRFSLQTGPAYTDVGYPHTGRKLNWMTDLQLVYKWIFVGYSHTSNAGTHDLNRGLDMVTVGFSIPLGGDRE